jgi:hypothetical protein
MLAMGETLQGRIVEGRYVDTEPGSHDHWVEIESGIRQGGRAKFVHGRFEMVEAPAQWDQVRPRLR